MFAKDMRIDSYDPELDAALSAEVARQENHVELIASDNYASPRVLQAAGTVLTNKYAEGYPGKRYYGGCEHVDVVERLAIDRAKTLFDAEFANVQPHSGSQANMAVYMTALEPGDTVLGLDLAHGGHLTHGMKLNISGKLYNYLHYGVTRDTHRIDFDQVASLAREHKPKMIVAGASAYPREIPHDRFAEIAREVGAKLFVAKACNTCHKMDGSSSTGPTLKNIYGHAVPLEDGTQVTVDENYLRESMLNPSAKVVAGFQPVMPTYQGLLRNHEIDALIAYIKSMQEGEEPTHE